MKLEIVDVNNVPAAVRSQKKHLELYLAVERLPDGKALKLQIRDQREAKTLREAVRKFMKEKGLEIRTVSTGSGRVEAKCQRGPGPLLVEESAQFRDKQSLSICIGPFVRAPVATR